MHSAIRYYSAYSSSSTVANAVKLHTSDNIRFKSFCDDSDESFEEESHSNAATASLLHTPEHYSPLHNTAKYQKHFLAALIPVFHCSLTPKHVTSDKVRPQDSSAFQQTSSEYNPALVTASVPKTESNDHMVSLPPCTKYEEENVLPKKAQKKVEMLSKANSICEFVCSVVEHSQNPAFRMEMLNMLNADTMGIYRRRFMNVLLENIELRFQ
ncbi:hypothetical protein M514_19644 [Trichuris suis]|uniref:Uncharacterized protein n=1 Tax=Trichuris suis TaxID=68888 RepID=A0A085NFB6_9BILA|nr:hypothetical protein M514_19644 [Trichuris suis]